MPVDAIKFGFDAERERLLEGATSVAKFPVEWGVITNWELFEDLMEHILYDAAGVQPEDTLLMLTEPPLCPKVTREKYTQVPLVFCFSIMFRTFFVQLVGVKTKLRLCAQT